MAIPTINFAGYVYNDAGTAVSGASVDLYAKNTTTTSLASDTTDSNGRWDINYTTAGTSGLDIQIQSGESYRRIKYQDKIHLEEVDTALLNIRGVEGAAAAMYFFADEGEDAGDRWNISVADAGVMTMGNDIQSQNTYVAHVTLTPNATVANSTFAVAGNLTVGNALTVTGTTTLNGNLVLGDAAADTLTIGATLQGASPLTFEGGTADGYETTFAITDPTADRTITFPNLAGTVQLSGNPITGTTIDASTDFTIGDTVITDGVVTDSTGLQLAANLDINGTVDISGAVTLGTVAAAGTDTDKFLVLDGSGNVDYRTGTQLLSDIGGTGATALDDISTGDAAASLVTTVGNITIDAQANDADVIIKVDDNGSAVTAVTFDGSDEGNAIFVNDIQLKSDSAVLKFGTDLDTTLTHTDGTGLTLNSTNKLAFGDTGTFIHQSSDGVLTIESDTTVDINGAVALNGAITGATDITLSGELDAATLDLSGNADIAGDLTLSAGTDGALVFTLASSIKILDDSTTALVIEEANNALMTFSTEDDLENVTFDVPMVINADPADAHWSGITAKFTAGEDLEDGECVYFKAADSKMWKAVSNTGGTGLITPEIMCVAMCVSDVSADAVGVFLLQGFIRANTNFPTYAIGETLYVPEAEVGGKNVPEGAIPDSDGDMVQIIGWAAGADTVYFNPDFTIIEHA